MSKSKTDQISEGEISFEDLQSSAFSFDIEGNFDLDEENQLQLDTDTDSEEEKEESQEQESQEEESQEESSEEKEEAQEEESEEQEESSEESEEEKEESSTDSSSTFYKNLSAKYLADGTWQDVEIEVEEGKSVKLSEIESIDEETFFAVQKAQNESSEEEIQDKYISKDGLDENALKIIDILKNGGDFKEVFKSPESFKKPFEGVDLDNEQNQQYILKEQYVRQGLSEEEAVQLVKVAVQNLTIDQKVQEIVTHYQKAYDKFLDDKQKEQAEKKKEDDKKLKEFKKGVMENLKGGFQLKESLARKLTNLGVEKTSTGDFKIDEIYEKKMEDPKEAAELLYFLSDKEGYLKMMGAKTKRSVNMNTLKKVSIIKNKPKKEASEEAAPLADTEFSFDVEVN